MYFYQYDPRIHNIGNIGLKGSVHAELAPFFTKLIDLKAYNGRNIRQEIINKLNPNKNKILDLCCGIGISTSEYGIDTSVDMINKAKRHFPKKKFFVGNAENFKSNDKFDIVTCMFAFHEMPEFAHNNIIKNSLKLAKKEIYIIDLSPEYKSSKLMQDGEPYLYEYQNSIINTMNDFKFERSDYINNHVTIWRYKL